MASESRPWNGLSQSRSAATARISVNSSTGLMRAPRAVSAAPSSTTRLTQDVGVRPVLPGSEQADAVGARHRRLQVGGDHVQRDAFVDVLDHRERGPQPQREPGHDPQRAQADGGRREAVVVRCDGYQLCVRGEQLDLVDLRRKAAESPSGAVRGGRAGAGHADVRQGARFSSAHPAACSRGQSSP